MKFDKNSKKYYELIDVVDRDISKAIQEDKERELRKSEQKKIEKKKRSKIIKSVSKRKKKKRIIRKKYGKFNLEIEDI